MRDEQPCVSGAARIAVCFAVSVVATAGAARGADAWPWSVSAPLTGGPKAVRLWLPEHVARIRGLFIFTSYGSFADYGASAGLRALATELRCGVVATEDAQLGDPPDDPARILDALRKLAAGSGHPEVAHAPLFIFGHSNSTNPMAQFGKKIADRIICWVAMKSASGGQFSVPELYQVPGMVVSGEKDDSYFGDQLATVKKLRREHKALVHMIVEANGPHWPVGETMEIMQAFVKTVFYLRVPADADATLAPVKLVALAESSGWLGMNLDGIRVSGPDLKWSWERPVDVTQLLEIAPYADFPGDRTIASWLPNGDYARKWQEFCHTAAINDWARMPPGFVEGWEARRQPPAVEGLESARLGAYVTRLAASSSYRGVIDELRRLAADASKPDDAAEAARIVAHVEKLGRERLEQALRLEATHPPTAAAAYRQIAQKFAGMAAGDAARTRHDGAEFKACLESWTLLDAVRRARSAMKDVRGARPVAGDTRFAAANATAFQSMCSAAGALLRKYPASAAAEEARAILKQYEIPVPAGRGR